MLTSGTPFPPTNPPAAGTVAVQLDAPSVVKASTPYEGPDQCRRQHDRVTGPFDGRRVGLLETAVQMFDLSLGGCFVNSMHDQQEGVALTLKIDLPVEGWITVEAETVYKRQGFGFAARFTSMTPETAACLERAIRRIQARQV